MATQLFQPTNITPDVRGGFGNGTVISRSNIPGMSGFTSAFTVSWQVNGNTPMTAYQIDFYKNDGSGDLIYSTGKLTRNCPFYGVDARGDPQIFQETNVTVSDIEGSTYTTQQMKITQWWGDGTNDYVVQASPSLFSVKPALYPLISYDENTPPGPTNSSSSYIPITTSELILYGGFSGTGGDAMLWHQWDIWILGGDGPVLIASSGKVYGNAEVTFAYDGFLPGKYRVSLTGETAAGVQTQGMWLPGAWNPIYGFFEVSYDQQETNLVLNAARACNGESAVEVSWPAVASIPLAAASTGRYSMSSRYIGLASGASLVWNKVNGSNMNLGSDWTLVWSGVATFGTTLLSFTTRGYVNGNPYTGTVEIKSSSTYGAGHLTANYSYSGTIYEEGGSILVDSGAGSFGIGDSNVGSPMLGSKHVQMTFAITPEASFLCVYNRGTRYNDLIYASENTFPGNDLYPKGDHRNISADNYIPASAAKALLNITSITLSNSCTVEYCKVVDSPVDQAGFTSAYVNGDANEYDENTVFLATAKYGTWNAGNFDVDDFNGYSGVKVYRQAEGSAKTELVFSCTDWDYDFPVRQFLDYGARSQQGPYTYSMYMVGADTLINYPVRSDPVNPCFWNWTVLSCTENERGDYEVNRSYLFGKNLESGSVSNNNKPNVLQNFTRYPLVQVSPANYQSGTLQSLIGTIDYAGGQNQYSDTVDLKEAIFALSTSANILFLKSRKGDLWRIRPSGEILMDTMDNTREQAQTVRFPWVECGDAEDVSIYQVVES